MSELPTGASDARSSQAVLASRDARPRPACTGTALGMFERQVLVFPLLVVVLACASFLFGGTCAAWQWWTAVAAVTLVPFARRDQWRSALGAAGLFALLLFALRCLIPPLIWDATECPDMRTCHLPMIQLLIEGWNPVSDPLAERITSSLGLDLWGMAPLHVAFSMKALAIFSAVAFKHIGDPYALTFPLLVFLWLGVFLSGIRTFCGFARWALVAAFVFVLPMVAWRLPVDLALAFASCGLLFAMQDALRGKRCNWIALTVWAAWMMTLKLNGIMGLAVFATAFAVAKTWKKPRDVRKRFASRFAAWIAIVILVAGLVSWNPFATSWQNFGHPLYPYQTVDSNRFPVQDLAWDLQLGNQDWQTIGRAGLMCRSYLSPRLTDSFYRWKLHRSDFRPFCGWWSWKEATNGISRVGLWLTFGILLAIPAGRVWGVAGLFLLLLVPKNMIGFTRYQPWLSALGCLASGLCVEWAESKREARLLRALSVFLFFTLCFAAGTFGWKYARNIECKAKERVVVRRRIWTPFWRGPIEFRKQLAPFVLNFAPRYNYLTCFENRTRLLVRELGTQDVTSVETPAEIVAAHGLHLDWDERNWGGDSVPSVRPIPAQKETLRPSSTSDAKEKRETTKSWLLSPFGYWVSMDDDSEHLNEFLVLTGKMEGPTPSTTDKAVLVLRSWFVTYPKEVWRRFVSWMR